MITVDTVVTYKKTFEFTDNVTLNATAGFHQDLGAVTPENPNDILIGHKLYVHSDSDDVADFPPYTSQIWVRSNVAAGDFLPEDSVTFAADSYYEVAGTYFLHATLVAVYAVVEL